MKSANNSPTEEVSKITGTFESFDGTPIYYEIRGNGQPVVLCYGLACVINHWTNQIRYFSHGYQTIAFDYRGTHLSGMPRDLNTLSFDSIARDLNGLLKHLGLKQASLWGHSFGAQALLRYYELFPETVSNLVFINGFAKNPITGMFGLNSMPKVFELFKRSYEKYPAMTSAFWKTAALNPITIQLSAMAGGFNVKLAGLKNIEVYARGVAVTDIDVFIRYFQEMMRYNGEPVLEKIEVPTLIIGGTKDGVTPRAHQQNLQSKIRDSQYTNIPYGTHCTQLDFPDFVNLRIEKFFDEIGYLPTPDKKTQGRGKVRNRKRPWQAGTLGQD